MNFNWVNVRLDVVFKSGRTQVFRHKLDVDKAAFEETRKELLDLVNKCYKDPNLAGSIQLGNTRINISETCAITINLAY